MVIIILNLRCQAAHFFRSLDLNRWINFFCKGKVKAAVWCGQCTGNRPDFYLPSCMYGQLFASTKSVISLSGAYHALLFSLLYEISVPIFPDKVKNDTN